MAVSYTPIKSSSENQNRQLKKNQKAKMLGFKKMLSKNACKQSKIWALTK